MHWLLNLMMNPMRWVQSMVMVVLKATTLFPAFRRFYVVLTLDLFFELFTHYWLPNIWGFYPTTMGFPTKNDHFWGPFWGYHHLRKDPQGKPWQFQPLETPMRSASWCWALQLLSSAESCMALNKSRSPKAFFCDTAMYICIYFSCIYIYI